MFIECKNGNTGVTWQHSSKYLTNMNPHCLLSEPLKCICEVNENNIRMSLYIRFWVRMCALSAWYVCRHTNSKSKCFKSLNFIMFQFRIMSLSDSGSIKRIKGGKNNLGTVIFFFCFSSVYFQRDKNIYTEGQAWLTEKTQKRPVCFSLIQAWIRSFSSGTVERGEKYRVSIIKSNN